MTIPSEMSRRDHFAIQIMAGMIANTDIPRKLEAHEMAKHSVRVANALIEQLDRFDGESEEKIKVNPSEAYWSDRECLNEYFV